MLSFFPSLTSWRHLHPFPTNLQISKPTSVKLLMILSPPRASLILIYLFGDFNLPGVDWSSSNSMNGAALANLLAGLASTHNLRQINTIPKFRGVYLDLVFSSIPTSPIAAADDVLLVEAIHHPALSFSLHIHMVKNSNKYKYIPVYRRSILDAIFHSIQGYNFPLLQSSSDEESSFLQFHNWLQSLVINIHSFGPSISWCLSFCPQTRSCGSCF